MSADRADPERNERRVRPGAILRAMGAAEHAITPNFDGPATFDAGADGHPAARLEVERNGDRVARIVVHCACGQRTVIDCDYAEPVAASRPKAPGESR